MQHIKILYFSFSNMHPGLDGHEFEQDLGVGEGQGGWYAAVHGVANSATKQHLHIQVK